MVLFVDVNNKILTLYKDNGVINIPFQNAGELYKHTENKKFLYVTKAIETNAQEVIKLIENMGTSVKAPIKEKYTYIHVKGEGVIPIDDLLRFRGKYDCHPLTSELIKKIEDTPLLQMLIKNKKLEMITSSERKKLKEEYEKKEDEKLGSILVDREEMEEKGDHDDAEVLDFTSELTSTRPMTGSADINTMSDLSELLVDMEGLE